MKWFEDARQDNFEKRFGLFIHFGIFAQTEWHEQTLWRRELRRSEYEILAETFDPNSFDPDAWIDTAESAGMEYICITTKHHDGFCMWDTAATEYKITNTPYKKDFLAQLSEACARRGMGLGVYYSLPDWHHPTYPNKGRHHEMFGPRSTDTPDDEAYLDFVETQISELCDNYGSLVQFFWDVNVAGFWKPKLNELIREKQPGIIINDRGPGKGDFVTPERKLPEGMAFAEPTIAVQSTGRESWGYRAGEDYYTFRHLAHSIDRFLAMGGNYQLNVGPKPDGTIGEHDVRLFERIGDWYRRVREAFGDAEPATYLLQNTGMDIIRYDQALLTRRGRSVYVHSPADLQTSGIMLHPIKWKPEKAVCLNNGQELTTAVDVTPWRWRDRPALRIIDLPVDALPDEPLVVRLDFAEELFT